MGTTLQIEDREERLSRARAALGAAERSAARWGGRIDRTALQPSARPVSEAEDDGLGARLPVPGPLRTLFPRGSLRAGSSVALEGAASTSLLLSLAVAAAGEDSWCAIAGMPDLGLRSAMDAGLDPCRLVLAPADGEQRPQVLSALADGVGVLVLGPDLDLAPALWRSLLGRARTADTLVLAAAPPGRADLTLRSTARGWSGLGQGSGRLRRRRLEIIAEGRGIAGHRSAEVLLPQVDGMLAAAPAGAAAGAAARPAVAERRPAMQLLPSARRAG
ncbi:hypothetical protein HMPREF3159_16470 [Brachybacterium sp. HMSC06H03]|uniref:hypothetical protein n=1 Tax=Brachybacterium sp. HMSC06H03 TaxID=1581127 RepID=UPI0008A1DC24|nr:hypothetical protein [Brachybacterium sp. HMSC06H03]OFT43917.1 hypothetical protein HMPREF3159_16470 [Brachybacterium sp. HMSC06H03]